MCFPALTLSLFLCHGRLNPGECQAFVKYCCCTVLRTTEKKSLCCTIYFKIRFNNKKRVYKREIMCILGLDQICSCFFCKRCVALCSTVGLRVDLFFLFLFFSFIFLGFSMYCTKYYSLSLSIYWFKKKMKKKDDNRLLCCKHICPHI